MNKTYTFYNSQGERIKLIRILLQVTQPTLARWVKTNQPTLARTEKNLYKPRRELSEKIADVMKLNLDWLVCGTPPIFQADVVLTDLLPQSDLKFKRYLESNYIDQAIQYISTIERVKECFSILDQRNMTITSILKCSSPLRYIVVRSDVSLPVVSRALSDITVHQLNSDHPSNKYLSLAFNDFISLLYEDKNISLNIKEPKYSLEVQKIKNILNDTEKHTLKPIEYTFLYEFMNCFHNLNITIISPSTIACKNEDDIDLKFKMTFSTLMEMKPMGTKINKIDKSVKREFIELGERLIQSLSVPS